MAESEEEAAAIERRERLEHIESSVRAQLEQRGAIALWEKMRDKMHCEAFVRSRTGGRMISTLMNTIIEAQTLWIESVYADDIPCIEAHRRARSALLSIQSLDEILADGGEAEAELRRIDVDLGEPDDA